MCDDTRYRCLSPAVEAAPVVRINSFYTYQAKKLFVWYSKTTSYCVHLVQISRTKTGRPPAGEEAARVGRLRGGAPSENRSWRGRLISPGMYIPYSSCFDSDSRLGLGCTQNFDADSFSATETLLLRSDGPF